MEVPEATPPTSDLSAAIGGVRRGRELAARLVALLRREARGEDAVGDEAGGLTEQVLASFSTALSALDASGELQVSGMQASPRGSGAHGGREGRTGRRRSFRPPGERRRCRTRRSQPDGWTTVETKTLEDGYIWRKYGQKEIRDAKYPRCYFRCTHKHDRGCQAARQVEKSEQDPSMFLITYLGQHTCSKPEAPVRPGAAEVPFVITFGSPAQALTGGARGMPPPPVPFPGLQAEQETEDDALSGNGCSSPAYHMLPELTLLEASAGVSTVAPDVAGDETSGLIQLGVDFTWEYSFQFGDMIGLEHDDFSFVYY